MPTAIDCRAGAPAEPDIERISRLLTEALALLDDLGAAPEIGARLQHVIDQISVMG